MFNHNRNFAENIVINLKIKKIVIQILFAGKIFEQSIDPFLIIAFLIPILF